MNMNFLTLFLNFNKKHKSLNWRYQLQLVRIRTEILHQPFTSRVIHYFTYSFFKFWISANICEYKTLLQLQHSFGITQCCHIKVMFKSKWCYIYPLGIHKICVSGWSQWTHITIPKSIWDLHGFFIILNSLWESHYVFAWPTLIFKFLLHLWQF